MDAFVFSFSVQRAPSKLSAVYQNATNNPSASTIPT
ncbi:hypothetical protein VV99796_01470 [Vibrio vulnificus]|nr:hypothetical protein VV99796_01470 [Vibrio vulnificus]OJI50840.1 hypothetical protein VVS316_01173 [Vibrio vulnificus]